MNPIQACLFDLDGVLVDTAKYHFLAWKRLAAELGFEFTEQDNEKLKGVSRMASLDILLGVGGLQLEDNVKQELAERKNNWYVEYISRMDASEILPGALEFLQQCRENGLKTALGSASKNAPIILQNTGLTPYFDAIIDGTRTSSAKPDPEVFLLGASELGVPPEACVVFEDAEAGIEAARRAGMRCIGIGSPATLGDANRVVSSLGDVSVALLQQLAAE
ncbi:Beta-phosphoglucomutase [compost metagenome]|jgi:beta-phosphoglucomutase|uniref:Beta-phosphoglucomutase n=1 Tax=Paenibacillus rhizolycopersici TaxID=2780073 RepID=A0ABS2H044_9BACL|nr:MULTISPECIES: beta-phosphoglucomutase [Paenibacillus]MBM6994632.1 beta-phosphoglucomutase [Paenibacillus rhizolycopersici]MUG87807.1 beta-phosphoglucomutase [Paenibacillus timonensis]GIP50721.1 beta-phosphoglucomutase [Paenibacillus sp. J53TS2]